jgi:hypothetical protein
MLQGASKKAQQNGNLYRDQSNNAKDSSSAPPSQTDAADTYMLCSTLTRL